MKDFLKALALGVVLIPYRCARGLGLTTADLARAYTCAMLGHDMYKTMCVRCGYEA